MLVLCLKCVEDFIQHTVQVILTAVTEGRTFGENKNLVKITYFAGSFNMISKQTRPCA